MPEGIEGQVPYHGPADAILHRLAGRCVAMGYVGAATIEEFQARARFARISGAGLRESRVYDVADHAGESELSDGGEGIRHDPP